MKTSHTFLVLSLVGLVVLTSSMGSSRNRGGADSSQNKRRVAASPSPTPRPSPKPSQSEMVVHLTEVQELIEGFNKGEEAGPYEMTSCFTLNQCDSYKTCELAWTFRSFDALKKPGVERNSATCTVTVKLASLDPELVIADGTRVRLGTKDGKSITVTIKANSTRAGAIVNGEPVPTTADILDHTDSWRIELRVERGARKVADLFRKVLTESAPSP